VLYKVVAEDGEKEGGEEGMQKGEERRESGWRVKFGVRIQVRPLSRPRRFTAPRRRIALRGKTIRKGTTIKAPLGQQTNPAARDPRIFRIFRHGFAFAPPAVFHPEGRQMRGLFEILPFFLFTPPLPPIALFRLIVLMADRKFILPAGSFLFSKKLSPKLLFPFAIRIKSLFTLVQLTCLFMHCPQAKFLSPFYEDLFTHRQDLYLRLYAHTQMANGG
jgi:hypothetical protein